MSLETQCQDAIFSYANADTQRNAALTGEHKEYVLLVLQLLRDQYKMQRDAGATEFVVPTQTSEYLTEQRPW
jgi:hypothetical protein